MIAVAVILSCSLSAQVAQEAKLQITSNTNLPLGTVGTPYSSTLQAKGGTPPYGWMLASGDLPTGLSLGLSSGTIGGTPANAGNFGFQVRVVDVQLTSDTKNFQLAIAPAASPLTITTTSLPDATVGAAYSQTLSASGGTPPYAWSVASGSLPAGLALSGSGTISGTPSAAGSSTFTARVTDSATNSATASLTINVRAPALVVATASLLAPGIAGVAYSQTLSATGGTPPYTWSVAAGALPAGLSLSAAGAISGTPAAAGIFTFTGRVADTAGASTAKDFSITVAPGVTISVTTLAGALAGVAYSQTLTASGGTPPYTWSLAGGTLPAGLSLSSSGAISGTPTTAGTFRFTARATDSAGSSSTADFTITVAAGLAVATQSLPNGTVGVAYSQILSATGGTPPYTWSAAAGLPPGISVAADGTVSGTPTSAGDFRFTVTVTDKNNTTASQSFTVSIVAGLAVATQSLPNGTVGVAYSQKLLASGGTPPYTWSAGAGLPPGISVGADGTVSGTPASAGDFRFTVTVTDTNTATASQGFLVTIGAAVAIATQTLPNGTVGVAYLQTLSATGGTAPYAWSGTGFPPGIGLSSSGTLSGTPTTTGTFNFTINVSDKNGGTASQNYSITIGAALGITTQSLPNGTVGTAYSQQLTAQGGQPPLGWAVAAGSLPPGITLASDSGLLSGAPSAAGTFPITIRVTDSSGATSTKDLSIRVVSNVAIITVTALPPPTTGASYTQKLDASGGTPPYTWSIAGGSLPAGMTLDGSTGTLSGAPSASGSFSFTVRVTDSGGQTATKDFTLAVSAALTITTSPVLPGGSVGFNYSQTLLAAGGRAPYTWSITSGATPAGISLNASTGVVAGVPTASGDFHFTATVTDGASVTASKDFSLTTAAGLEIASPPQLSDAQVGVPYREQLVLAGGRPPYSVSVVTGSLPPGVTINPSDASLAGTPTSPGTFRFTLRLTDSASASTTKDHALQVSLPSAPTLEIAGIADSGSALQQSRVDVVLASAYPMAISGQLALAFDPDTDAPADDPAIQFSTGGRTVNFTIPAGETHAIFAAGPDVAVQTGSVSGTITVTAGLRAAGLDLGTPVIRSMSIPRLPPAIRSVRAVRTPSGFEVTIVGYSPPRSLSQATFRFVAAQGANVTTPEVSVPLADAARAWFTGQQSAPFGSQFTLVQPFNVQGDTSTVAAVVVSLENGQGRSETVRVDF